MRVLYVCVSLMCVLLSVLMCIAQVWWEDDNPWHERAEGEDEGLPACHARVLGGQVDVYVGQAQLAATLWGRAREQGPAGSEWGADTGEGGQGREAFWAFAIARRRRAAAASVGELVALVSARGRAELSDSVRECAAHRGRGAAFMALYHAAVASVLARAGLLESAAGCRFVLSLPSVVFVCVGGCGCA
jgi:hypothetical protein